MIHWRGFKDRRRRAEGNFLDHESSLEITRHATSDRSHAQRSAENGACIRLTTQQALRAQTDLRQNPEKLQARWSQTYSAQTPL